MPISGSQLAYKQARSGIMRSGASRSNYFTYNVVVTINSVNVTSVVRMNTLRIEQVLNDEPDVATFGIQPGASVTPTAGQVVGISLGSAGNYEFAGQIVRVSRTYEKTKNGPLSFLDVECVDYGRLLDRRLVLADYTGRSASDIAADIIARFTDGFSSAGVATGLPIVDSFPVTNETVQATLRRLSGLIGGVFYVDNYRTVHMFGQAGDQSPSAGTNPLPLVPTSTTLRSFSYTSDAAQLRTRVIVEGQTTTCPNGSPGSSTVGSFATVDYMLVAGGGSGGHSSSSINAGGGGGGMLEGSTVVASGAYPVVIGGGGSVAFPGANGNPSTVFGLSATGGGKGAADSASGVAGGSGGGGTGNRGSLQGGGAGTAGQGSAGGTGGYWFSLDVELFFSIGGGGGGAGGAGGNADVNQNDFGRPGNGGPGRVSAINGTPTYYGGGGAGNSGTGQVGTGGAGGGGNSGVSGAANTGGGGGAGGNGGSGVVIISYKTGDCSATGGTITTSGTRTVHTFTANDTFTVATITSSLPPGPITDFPILDQSHISTTPGTVRIGNAAFPYTAVLGPTLSPGQNPPGTVLTNDGNPGDSSLFVQSGTSTFTQSTGWVKVEEQFIRYTSVSATEIAIPSSGYGSLNSKVKAGATVTWVGSLQIPATTFDPPFPSGTQVVQRVTSNDTTAQATVASLEGGDGIHEQIVSDDRLNLAGAQGRGLSELAVFSTPTGIVEAQWDTDDVNARPGRQQFASFDGLTDTLLITRAEVTFPVKNRKPFRHCEASSLKQPGLQDVVLVTRS